MQILGLAGLHKAEMALGQDRLASRGSAPSTGRPIRSMPSRQSRRWRSLATLLRITPTTRMRSS